MLNWPRPRADRLALAAPAWEKARVSFQDHFSSQAVAYARARPRYPDALFSALAGCTAAHDLAWDAGSGNGQAAVGLALHYARVVATEPSASQLAQARAHERVHYFQSAETAPMLADASVDLVTVAQAAHWFDRPRFYAEVARVLRRGGVLALWVYELCTIDPTIDDVLQRFYRGPIWPCWPPERRHAETGYRQFEFPFPEMEFPTVAMVHDWTLEEFGAYLRTWSSVSRYVKEFGGDPVAELEQALLPLWGGAARARRITWPICGRIGRAP